MQEDLLKQKPLVEKYLAETKSVLSSHLFVNIFSWQEFFKFEFKIIKNSLCIFASNEIGTFLYLPPLGEEVDTAVYDLCFQYMKDLNKGSGVSRIENVGDEQIGYFLENKEKYKIFTKASEYCYYLEDIAGLTGNRFKSKRSSYNQCVKKYPYEFLPFESKMLDECMALYHYWREKRRKEINLEDPKSNDLEIFNQMLDDNYGVNKLLMQYHKELGLFGRVIIVKNKIKAYTFGCAINNDWFCILSEIADSDIKGSAVAIFRDFAKELVSMKIKFINTMDDFGLDNIKETKLSFHPSVLLQSYVVSEKERNL